MNILRTYPRLKIHSFYKNVRLKMPNIYEHAKNIPEAEGTLFLYEPEAGNAQHLRTC